MPKITIPNLLRPLCDQAGDIIVPAGTLDAVLKAADMQCPGFYERIVEVEEHRLRLELAIALDGEITRLSLHQQIREDAHLAIVPAIGGG
jgi:hypothetical protein